MLFVIFIPFCLLILITTSLRLGSMSSTLSSGFCVPKSREYYTFAECLTFFGFSFWLIVWADRVSGCGWCFVGERVCKSRIHNIFPIKWEHFTIPFTHTSIRFHHFLVYAEVIMFILLLLQIMSGVEGCVCRER